MFYRLILSMPFIGLGALFAWAFPLLPTLCASAVLLVIWFSLMLFPDKWLLHFFQAREAARAEYPVLAQILDNQAYKLSMPTPYLYTYNGFFPRAYAFARFRRAVLVLERGMLDEATSHEMEALLFNLCLQVKEKIAAKNTFSYLAFAAWWFPFLKLSSRRNAVVWLGQFVLLPFAAMTYEIGEPSRSHKRFLNVFLGYEKEAETLSGFMARLRPPRLRGEWGRTMAFRLAAANHGPRERLILALESLEAVIDRTAPVREMACSNA